MRRLDFVQRRRKTTFQSHTSADAAMMLAQVTFERRRLDQERISLQKRLRRIDGRLTAIASMQSKLLPAIGAAASRASTLAGASLESCAPSAAAPMAGFSEMVVRY